MCPAPILIKYMITFLTPLPKNGTLHQLGLSMKVHLLLADGKTYQMTQLKIQHSLCCCPACYHEYESLQRAFPAKPVHVVLKTSIVSLAAEKSSQKEVAQKVLRELNLQWSTQYNSTFTNALTKIKPELNLTERLSKTERKKKDRKQKRKIVNHINKQIGGNTTMCLLAEGESLSAYNRMRLSMSFEQTETPSKKHKSHSPREENITWDWEGAVESLRNFPEEEIVNWTGVARRCGGTTGNSGQVLKEVAMKCGIDIQKLEHKDPSLPRIRSRNRKLSGGKISILSLPTTADVINSKAQLIEWRTINWRALFTLQSQ